MIAAPEQLTNQRVCLRAAPSAFDRENKVIRGVKLAELGSFGTKGRGRFTQRSFDLIKQHYLAHLPRGLRCRLTHPNMSDDGLTKTLGRMRNLRQAGDAIVGDLHFLDMAFKPPVDGGETSYGEFIFGLAQEDDGLLETSFVLDVDQEYELESDGTRKLDEMGEPLAPIWLPVSLYASDVVGDGDAVHTGFLSSRNHSLYAAKASEVLDKLFEGRTREEIDGRATAFVKRYLNNRFGEIATPLGEQEVTTENSKSEGLSQEDKDWIMQSLGSVVDSKIQPIADQVQQLNSASELQERNKQIQAWCEKLGQKELAADFINDTSLSSEDVRAKLFDQYLEKRSYPDHPGDDPGSDGTGTGQQTLSDTDKARAELGKQFDATPDVFKSLGIDREEYIRGAMLSSGKLPEQKKLREELQTTNPLAATLVG